MICELKYSTIYQTATGARAAKKLRKLLRAFIYKTCVSEEDKGQTAETPVTSKRRTADVALDGAAADADAAV